MTLGEQLHSVQKEWERQHGFIQQYRTILGMIARHPDKADKLIPEIERVLQEGR